MAKWIAHSLHWREDKTHDYYLKLLEKYEQTEESIGKKTKSKTVELEESRDNYAFKFIVVHISMFCTQNINSDGKFTTAYYSASHVLFLRSFIKLFHSKSSGRKIIRSIEKAMGDFNLKQLSFEYQDPVSASQNALYKVEEFPDRLDFISFAKLISNNEDDFDEYLQAAHPIDKYAELDEKKIEDFNKNNYKTKSRILISFMKNLSEFKDNDILKAHFQLVSKECPTSKHVVISIAGLSGESTKQTKKWEDYLQYNRSLTVYSFKWKTKGMLPSLSSFMPKLTSLLDIASLFSKAYLAYKAIKIPIEYRSKFMDCWEMSKFYGKILAHSLMLQFPFVNQSVSL